LLKHKVIAQNIINLTDARYFAAWGIDYMSFNTIPDSDYYISEAEIKEIKDWVEGPKCLLEANALEFDELAEGFILSNIYSSLPIVKETFFRISFEDISKGLPAGKYISPITMAQLEVLPKLQIDPECDFYFNISQIDNNSLSRLENYGLVVQGGAEEKVGLKTYDDLDEIYDYLID